MLKTSPVGSTMMAASPELMDAERDFFKVLNNASSAKILNEKLLIADSDCKKLVFERAK